MARERDFGPVQLADWLGLKPRQLRRAQVQGLIPPPDVDDTRWSLTVGKTVAVRLEEILAAEGDQQDGTPAPPVEPVGRNPQEGSR